MTLANIGDLPLVKAQKKFGLVANDSQEGNKKAAAHEIAKSMFLTAYPNQKMIDAIIVYADSEGQDLSNMEQISAKRDEKGTIRKSKDRSRRGFTG